MRAMSQWDTSAWTETRAFTTIPYIPDRVQFIYPGQNALGMSLSPTLMWKKSSRATLYTVKIAPDSSLSSLIFSKTTTDTTLLVSGLSYYTSYYWKVSASNSGGVNDSSQIQRFKTTLNSPTILSPSNKARDISRYVSLKWGSVYGASRYQLEMATDSLFTTKILSVQQIDSTRAVGPLSYQTNYYWRVCALDDSIQGAFASSSFMTGGPILSLDKHVIDYGKNLPGSTKQLQFSISNSGTDTLFIDTLYSTSKEFKVVSQKTSMEPGHSIAIVVTFSPTNINTRSAYIVVRDVNNVSDSVYVFGFVGIPKISFSVQSMDFGSQRVNTITKKGVILQNQGNDTLRITQITSSSRAFAAKSDYFVLNPGQTINDTISFAPSLTSGSAGFIRYENTLSADTLYVNGNIAPIAAQLQDVFNNSVGKQLLSSIPFSASTSLDPDGKIIRYEWLVDGKTIDTNQNISYKAPQGTTRIMLRVTDDKGSSDSSEAKVDIAAAFKKMLGSVEGGITALDEQVLFVSDVFKSQTQGAKLYQVDENLQPIFELTVTEQIKTAASISYDSSVFITNGPNLNGFNKFGISMWPTLSLGGITQVTPTIDSVLNRIYLGVSNKNFFGYDYKTGNPIWFYRPDAPISASAVLTADRKLIFPTEKGTIYGFDLIANSTPDTPTWIKEFADSVVLAPAVDADNNIILGTKSGRILKINFGPAGLVSTLWATSIGNRISTSPVIDASGFIYVGCEDGVLRKIDPVSGQVIWSYITTTPIRTTPAISQYGRLYFGNDGGVFSCIDTSGKKLWQFENPVAITASVLHMNGTSYIGTTDGYVYSFYDGGGASAGLAKSAMLVKNPVWGTYQGNNRRTGSARDNGIATTVRDKTFTPTQYSLLQNYPNPFNPSTKIVYSVPERSSVRISIYNILGQEIRNVVNNVAETGYYEQVFDASGLPSGAYLYRIEAYSMANPSNSYVTTKKMILMK
jgi:hypothetical protein